MSEEAEISIGIVGLSEWEVEEKRTALIDRALQIIKERDGQ